MKATRNNKKGNAPQPDSLKWCDHCRLRIAPGDKHVTFMGRPYHSQCHIKVQNACEPTS